MLCYFLDPNRTTQNSSEAREHPPQAFDEAQKSQNGGTCLNAKEVHLW
jgi:hypothetical protein